MDDLSGLLDWINLVGGRYREIKKSNDADEVQLEQARKASLMKAKLQNELMDDEFQRLGALLGQNTSESTDKVAAPLTETMESSSEEDQEESQSIAASEELEIAEQPEEDDSDVEVVEIVSSEEDEIEVEEDEQLEDEEAEPIDEKQSNVYRSTGGKRPPGYPIQPSSSMYQHPNLNLGDTALDAPSDSDLVNASDENSENELDEDLDEVDDEDVDEEDVDDDDVDEEDVDVEDVDEEDIDDDQEMAIEADAELAASLVEAIGDELGDLAQLQQDERDVDMASAEQVGHLDTAEDMPFFAEQLIAAAMADEQQDPANIYQNFVEEREPEDGEEQTSSNSEPEMVAVDSEEDDYDDDDVEEKANVVADSLAWLADAALNSSAGPTAGVVGILSAGELNSDYAADVELTDAPSGQIEANEPMIIEAQPLSAKLIDTGSGSPWQIREPTDGDNMPPASPGSSGSLADNEFAAAHESETVEEVAPGDHITTPRLESVPPSSAAITANNTYIELSDEDVAEISVAPVSFETFTREDSTRPEDSLHSSNFTHFPGGANEAPDSPPALFSRPIMEPVNPPPAPVFRTVPSESPMETLQHLRETQASYNLTLAAVEQLERELGASAAPEMHASAKRAVADLKTSGGGSAETSAILDRLHREFGEILKPVLTPIESESEEDAEVVGEPGQSSEAVSSLGDVTDNAAMVIEEEAAQDGATSVEGVEPDADDVQMDEEGDAEEERDEVVENDQVAQDSGEVLEEPVSIVEALEMEVESVLDAPIDTPSTRRRAPSDAAVLEDEGPRHDASSSPSPLLKPVFNDFATPDAPTPRRPSTLATAASMMAHAMVDMESDEDHLPSRTATPAVTEPMGETNELPLAIVEYDSYTTVMVSEFLAPTSVEEEEAEEALPVSQVIVVEANEDDVVEDTEPPNIIEATETPVSVVVEANDYTFVNDDEVMLVPTHIDESVDVEEEEVVETTVYAVEVENPRKRSLFETLTSYIPNPFKRRRTESTKPDTSEDFGEARQDVSHEDQQMSDGLELVDDPEAMAAEVDAFVDSVSTSVNAIGSTFVDVAEAIGEATEDVVNDALQALEQVQETVEDAVNKAEEVEADEVTKEVVNEAREVVETIEDVVNEANQVSVDEVEAPIEEHLHSMGDEMMALASDLVSPPDSEQEHDQGTAQPEAMEEDENAQQPEPCEQDEAMEEDIAAVPAEFELDDDLDEQPETEPASVDQDVVIEDVAVEADELEGAEVNSQEETPESAVAGEDSEIATDSSLFEHVPVPILALVDEEPILVAEDVSDGDLTRVELESEESKSSEEDQVNSEKLDSEAETEEEIEETEEAKETEEGSSKLARDEVDDEEEDVESEDSDTESRSSSRIRRLVELENMLSRACHASEHRLDQTMYINRQLQAQVEEQVKAEAEAAALDRSSKSNLEPSEVERVTEVAIPEPKTEEAQPKHEAQSSEELEKPAKKSKKSTKDGESEETEVTEKDHALHHHPSHPKGHLTEFHEGHEHGGNSGEYLHLPHMKAKVLGLELDERDLEELEPQRSLRSGHHYGKDYSEEPFIEQLRHASGPSTDVHDLPSDLPVDEEILPSELPEGVPNQEALKQEVKSESIEAIEKGSKSVAVKPEVGSRKRAPRARKEPKVEETPKRTTRRSTRSRKAAEGEEPGHDAVKSEPKLEPPRVTRAATKTPSKKPKKHLSAFEAVSQAASHGETIYGEDLPTLELPKPREKKTPRRSTRRKASSRVTSEEDDGPYQRTRSKSPIKRSLREMVSDDPDTPGPRKLRKRVTSGDTEPPVKSASAEEKAEEEHTRGRRRTRNTRRGS
ncbi:hypothetical protein DICA3_C04390 [Diutina catenulata]